ncbi:hypothetical protein Trydic_g13904 [Trypoxylus dichotomus]
MLTMKSLLALLIVGCIVSSEINAYSQGRLTCDTPGRPFYDGCNICDCTEEGYVGNLCPIKVLFSEKTRKEF